MSRPERIVYAIGSPYVHDVCETLQRLGWSVKAWAMNQPGDVPAGLGRVISSSELTRDEFRESSFIVPLITPGHRRTVELELSAKGAVHFATVIDPTTVVARTAEIAEGVYVNAGGTIGANVTLQRWSQVNRSASIGHGSVVEAYASVGPGSVVCGLCVIGRGAFIGAGAIINPKVRVGANAIVGAGTVVTQDVADNTMVAAKSTLLIRSRVEGYNGVGV